MPDRTLCKAQLRKKLRSQRQALTTSAQQIAATRVVDHFIQLPRWQSSRRIALYLPNDGEIGTACLATRCREAGKQLFLPVITGSGLLEFASWTADDELVLNRFGIPQPLEKARRCPVADLDILTLPLVAWDHLGGRLGMGGGFYDRTLAGSGGTLTVGLAHALQQISKVPQDDWDIALNFVATDTALHYCSSRISPE